MRVQMTKPVPAYPYPGAVSTSTERAFNLVMNDCAVAIDPPQSFIDRVERAKKEITNAPATDDVAEKPMEKPKPKPKPKMSKRKKEK